MQKKFKAVYILAAPGVGEIPDFPILENQIKKDACVNDATGADRSLYLEIGVGPDKLVFAVKNAKDETTVGESAVMLDTKEWSDYVQASINLLKYQKPAAITQFLSDEFIRADERVVRGGALKQYNNASKKLGDVIAQQVLRERRITISDSLSDPASYETFASLAHIALGFSPSIRNAHKMSQVVLAAEIKADQLTP